MKKRNMLKIPESSQEVIYFTNRILENEGSVKAWARKKKCHKCGKALMGKPLDEKTGRPKLRAKEYVCHNCGYTEEKSAHENTLKLEAVYICPKCKKHGEATTEYKRKTFMGVPSFIISCQHCSEKIPITKKMKKPKKKGAAPEDDDDE